MKICVNISSKDCCLQSFNNVADVTESELYERDRSTSGSAGRYLIDNPITYFEAVNVNPVPPIQVATNLSHV